MNRRFEALALTVMVALLLIYRTRRIQRELALEQAHEKEQAGLALVRYVQMQRNASEEVGYKRIADFVKSHTALGEHPFIDYLLANNRSGLLALAQSILASHPDEIDEI
jgi:hypothetical protein